MLRVEVSLRTVGAREFAVCILLWNDRVLGSTATCLGGGSAGGAGQNAATTLRSYDVSRLLAVLEQGLLVRHHGASAVWGRQTRLRHYSACRHGAEYRRSRGWSRRDRLGVRGRDRSLRHHRRRYGIALLRLLILVRHHVRTASRTGVRWRVLAHGRRLRSVRSAWRPWSVWVAAVNGLHSLGVVLQRRQSMLK